MSISILIAMSAALLPLFSSCSSGAPASSEQTAAQSTQQPENDKTPADTYSVISISDYTDKTVSGFLAQIVGMLSGFEFVKLTADRCRVGMPDEWFSICNGPYAEPNTRKMHTDKLLFNSESGIWETWNDDDFSVDILNQYILSDMYREKGTFSSVFISEGWLKYDVWDMGGGQRQAGAYGLITSHRYLPQFAGSTEYGNRYSYCTEPYLGADTIGMNAAGMPDTAAEMAGKFASVTGDRENVGWAQMFAVMYSLAYFESDIPALIRQSSKVFPAGAWQLSVTDEVFALYAEYPQDWRAAYAAFEKAHYTAGETKETNSTINCGFVLLDLLYGGGDYYETCKIGSLAGYDCESTCGIALTVVAIIQGTEGLPEEVNSLIWQDGKGVIVNRCAQTVANDYWMCCMSLPERLNISDITDMYRQNFESVLLENGGYISDGYYYIPQSGIKEYESICISDSGFESGKLEGWEVSGSAVAYSLPTAGKYSAKLTGGSGISQTVTGLQPGGVYRLSAYIFTSADGEAFLFARTADGGVCASVSKTEGYTAYTSQKSVYRELVFTASQSSAQIGLLCESGSDSWAVIDCVSLVRIYEESAGDVVLLTEMTDTGCSGAAIKLRITAEYTGEAYLKLTFANFSGTLTDSPITCGGSRYSTVAFRLTGSPGMPGLTAQDTLYIPMVLAGGENSVILMPANRSIVIYKAEYVTVQK